MATATRLPATGKNGVGPRWWTSTPETATDSRKLPNEQSISALLPLGTAGLVASVAQISDRPAAPLMLALTRS
jgi:hypothetical protein